MPSGAWERRVQDRNLLIRESRRQSGAGLGCQRDFGNEHQRRSSLGQDTFDQSQVDLGFARTSDAKQQVCGETVFKRSGDGLDDARRCCRRRRSRRRVQVVHRPTVCNAGAKFLSQHASVYQPIDGSVRTDVGQRAKGPAFDW